MILSYNGDLELLWSLDSIRRKNDSIISQDLLVLSLMNLLKIKLKNLI